MALNQILQIIIMIKIKAPSIEAINNTAKDLLESKNVKPADYDSAGKTTDEMKQQKPIQGFDFEKKWSISADEMMDIHIIIRKRKP